MIRFPDVVVAQRQGVPPVKTIDTKPLHQQQPQSQSQHTSTKLTSSSSSSSSSVQPAPKLNINFTSKNKKKNNHTYQVSGKKRNANNNNNAHNNCNTTNNNRSSGSTASSSNSSINGDTTAQVNNKNNNNVSYATNEPSYASFNNSAQSIQSGASSSKSISLDSISSTGADELCTNSTPAAMNLHLVKYLTNQHQSPSSNAVSTASPSSTTATAAAAAAAAATQNAKKSTYTVDFLHHVGAQMSAHMAIFGQSYQNAIQKHDYSNRMRPQRTEYSTYNGNGKSHSQYSNGNNDYGRYNNNTNINKFGNTPQHSKSHLSNASISPPLSVVSSGSSNHSGRASNHSNHSNHSNNMNYRNSQSYGMQSTHPSNHYQNNYFYQGSPFCGGNNCNGSNAMHQQQQSQSQQQQSNYSNNHHHPPNQKNLHQIPSPPIYHANNNYHSHNRNYQNGKKTWTPNYGRNKKYVNGNQYSSNNSTSSNSSNASNGTTTTTNKFTSMPNKNDFVPSSTTDRSRVDSTSNQYGSKAPKIASADATSTPSPSVSPITTAPTLPTGNSNYANGSDAERGGDIENTKQRYVHREFAFVPTDTTSSLLTISNTVTDRSNQHVTMPLNKIPTPRPLDASISPPICISPSLVTNSTVLPMDRPGAEAKNLTIMDRTMCSTMAAPSMECNDATPLSSCDASNMPPQFHVSYSTSPTHGPLLTEELFLRLNNGLTPSATNNNNTSSSSASADSSGSASMPMFNAHRNLILFDPHFFANNMPLPDFYNMPNAAFTTKSNPTHDGPHQKRSYSGNSSPTQGTKTYRNIQRDRQFNANRKPNTYSKSMGNLPKSQSPPDRFLQRLDSIELQLTAPESLCNQSVWDDLSQCIWEKCVERQQTKETYRNKMLLWLYLIDSIEQFDFMRYSIYLVGSTISGFGLDTSDVDMCLVSRCFSNLDARSEAMVHLSKLGEHLQQLTIFKEFNLIQAKVPILRFKDDIHKVEIDLNYNNCVGIRNTHLLHCYGRMDWRLRPLALIVKIWAQFHYINNAKDMTISSYSLILMVIHFLQCAVQPPVLPCLHAMYPEKFQKINDISTIDMNEDIEPYQSDNKQPLGELFLQFLEYYSNFNYEQHAISVRTAGVLPIEECRIVRSFKNEAHAWTNLCIEEPFDLTNTARSCYDEKIFERIKSVFVTSWQVLRDTLDLQKLFDEPFLAPPPQNIAFDNLPLAPNYPLLAQFS